MQCRDNLAHLILSRILGLVLTSLMVAVDAQAQIAFSSERDGNPEIYVMDINGKNQRRLTNNRGDDWSPSWSPDGKRIVFFSDRDGHVHPKHGWSTFEIYVMDADGGILKTSPIIPMMTRIPPGPPTVNVLPSSLIGIGIILGTLKST